MMRQGWQKSSFSGGGDGDHCIEIGSLDSAGRLGLRESEEPGVVVATSRAALAGLIGHVKEGQARGAQ
jgi:hypothetical protein